MLVIILCGHFIFCNSKSHIIYFYGRPCFRVNLPLLLASRFQYLCRGIWHRAEPRHNIDIQRHANHRVFHEYADTIPQIADINFDFRFGPAHPILSFIARR